MDSKKLKYYNEEEQQYLEILKRIKSEGIYVMDRTMVGVKALSGQQMKFNLGKHFPLLTTKTVPFKMIVQELLWFISGNTSAKVLAEMGTPIWNANATREFLDKAGLVHNEEGDLGPIYGFQWRHAGAKYENCRTDYKGKGFDQLAKAIDTIRNRPNDRRIIVSAWNINDIPNMALPPCHALFQFHVFGDQLDCCMFQRSGDMGLGVPFNIASYSLLTCMVAHVTGLKLGIFTHFISNSHIYSNHDSQLDIQLAREPREFPTLTFARPIDNIDDFKEEDIILNNYNPHPRIPMPMAV